MPLRDPLERLRDGKRLRALANWPAMLPHVRAGYVQRERLAGTKFAIFALTEKGRRKLNGYRTYAAGAGK